MKPNPLIKLLKKLNLISYKNIRVINNCTRDRKIKVLQDKKTKIIFLEKYIIDNDYIYCTGPNEKNYKVLGHNLNLKILEDEKRRSKQFYKYFHNKDILDFGCGYGNFFNYIKTAKSLTGVEVREKCYLYLKKKKKINIFKNINDIKKKFNTISLFHTLEHLNNPIEVLKGVKNKLKKNGHLIVEVPHANDFLFSKNIPQYKNFTFNSSHLILHTEYSLRKMLSFTKFKKIKIFYYQRYGLDNNLFWLLKGRPGGHFFYKKLIDKKLNEEFSKSLIDLKLTDTLIAIATK